MSNGVESLVYLDYILFVRKLAEELSAEAEKEGNGKGPIEVRHVEETLPRVLQRFRG